jgi:peptide/nickel transport system permease protein
VLKFTLKRVVGLVPIMLMVTLIMFLLLQLTPGDPARVAAGADASEEMVQLFRERMGLDQPLLQQYGSWVAGLVRGDFGTSLQYGTPVSEMILRRAPVTISLTLTATILGLLVAVPAAMAAAYKPDRIVDRSTVFATTFGISLPDFFIGLLLVLVFAIEFDVLPALGYVPFTESPLRWSIHMILPAVTLGAAVAAELTRHMRASLRDIVGMEYMNTARVKGLGTVRVMGKHALRNAAVPVVTVLGLQIRRLLGGTVIVERIFSLDGLGSLIVQGVFARDFPVILGVGIVSALTVVVVNLAVDLSYGFLDPRVRVGA